MTTPDSIPEDRANVEKARNLLRRASAVIFDFDGLLVDTEYAIYASWLRVFDSCGHPLPLKGLDFYPALLDGDGGILRGEPSLRLWL